MVWVDDMHTRKQLFLDLSDAFIALPGGFGTFEEVLECITWRQLGIHQLPICVLDSFGYYSHLEQQIEMGYKSEFIKHANLVSFCLDIPQVLQVIELESQSVQQRGFNLTWVKGHKKSNSSFI